MKFQNKWLDALVTALATREAHEAALAALVEFHGGKRTMPLMEDLLSGVRAVYPGTRAEISVRAGMPNVSFPDKGVGYQMWKDMILPHLPKMRAATTTKAKSRNSSKMELLVAYIAATKFGKAQVIRAVEAAFSK